MSRSKLPAKIDKFNYGFYFMGILFVFCRFNALLKAELKLSGEHYLDLAGESCLGGPNFLILGYEYFSTEAYPVRGDA